MKKINLILIMLCVSITYTACEKEAQQNQYSDGVTSTSGSLAVFAFYENYMYKVENDHLYIYEVSVVAQPKFIKTVQLPAGIETIVVNEYLFFGTSTGLLIYDITNPESPSYISKYEHIVSCDPVALKGNFAFVTLSNQNRCARGVNELHVVDISNIRNPKEIAKYSYNNPQGLAIQGNYIYLCEGNFGLRILNISNVLDIKTAKTIENIDVVDAIAKDGILTLQGPKGVYQYNYTTDSVNIKQVSFLPVQ